MPRGEWETPDPVGNWDRTDPGRQRGHLSFLHSIATCSRLATSEAAASPEPQMGQPGKEKVPQLNAKRHLKWVRNIPENSWGKGAGKASILQLPGPVLTLAG